MEHKWITEEDGYPGCHCASCGEVIEFCPYCEASRCPCTEDDPASENCTPIDQPVTEQRSITL